MASCCLRYGLHSRQTHVWHGSDEVLLHHNERALRDKEGEGRRSTRLKGGRAESA